MSDTGAQGFGAPAGDFSTSLPVGEPANTGANGDPGYQQQPNPQEVSYESQYSIANDFLKGVAEEDRPYVEKYIRQWDGGVTRRFKDIHNEYRAKLQPYEQLGADAQALQAAWQNYQFLSTPEGERAAYELLRQKFEQELQEQQLAQQYLQQYPQMLQGQGQNPYQQQPQQAAIPPQLQQKLAQQEQILMGMGNYLMQQRQQQLDQQAEGELDNYLAALRAEKGDFNERYVLTLMQSGVNGAQAVDMWRNELAQANAAMVQRQANVPPIISGSGMPPQQQKKLGDLSSNDTKGLVAQILARSQQS